MSKVYRIENIDLAWTLKPSWWRRYRANKLKALKIRKATLAVNNVFEDFVGFDWLHFKLIGTDKYNILYINYSSALRFFCWNTGQMLKTFRRESWRRNSVFLRNIFRHICKIRTNLSFAIITVYLPLFDTSHTFPGIFMFHKYCILRPK